jgi:hypothetical protein
MGGLRECNGLHRWALVPILLALAGCAASVAVTGMSAVAPDQLSAATNVRVFTIEQPAPKVERTIAPVTAYSCKHLTTDPPASRGDALL